MYKNHIVTTRAITIAFTDGSTSVIPVENPLFASISQRLSEERFDNLKELTDLSTSIRRHKSGRFNLSGETVYLDDAKLPDSLGKKVWQLAEAGEDLEALLNFWARLSKNPSEESKKDLYAFIAHNNIPITRSGFMVCYKRVKDNFKDVHTGKFDNSIGVRVTMKREDVNADRTITCSSGLHVANFDYAKQFYPNGILVEVLVSPEHVVSVPVDYNQAKMRTCEYVVIKVCDAPREEVVYPDSDLEHLDLDEDFEEGEFDTEEASFADSGIEDSLENLDYVEDDEE